MSKELKKYFNDNGLRFNLEKKRIWNYFDQIFGIERTKELSNIFDETFNSVVHKPSIIFHMAYSSTLDGAPKRIS